MALIDTNVLVYAVDEDSSSHAAAKKFLKSVVEGPETWHLTWQIVFEFLRTVTHPKAAQKAPLFIDEALNAVRKLLAIPSLQLIHPGARHFEIFAELAAHTPGTRGNFVHDVRLAAILIENGVRKIYTADESFRRFRDIDVVNPIR